jgi:5-hydroxyisourate hydrolase
VAVSFSTHVLDAAAGGGRPGVGVRLADHLRSLADQVTDADGRVAALASDLPVGDYRLTFSAPDDAFVAEVSVVVRCRRDGHYHVPLLLAGSAASVYLGSS